jgi:hypothetical protein
MSDELDLYREPWNWGRGAFAQRFNGLYLCRFGGVTGEVATGTAAPLGFRTQYVSTGSVNMQLAPAPAVVPIAKRDTNPFAERISVGRAPNCDIVLRLPFVSKLHAHFACIDNRGARLTDAGSANGTFVNGQRLVPSVVTPLNLRDIIRFGSLSLMLVDGAGLYDALAPLLRPDARSA